MFPTNQDHLNVSSSLLRKQDRANQLAPSQESELVFTDLASFSEWVSEQLLMVENHFQDFETVSSLRGFLKR